MSPTDPDVVAFHQAMLDIYEAAKRECKLVDNRFLQMVRRHGGVQTAQLLLRPGEPHDFLTRLILCRHPANGGPRLDLSVEALVLLPQWQHLFTTSERQEAWDRLKRLDYRPILSSELDRPL